MTTLGSITKNEGCLSAATESRNPAIVHKPEDVSFQNGATESRNRVEVDNGECRLGATVAGARSNYNPAIRPCFVNLSPLRLTKRLAQPDESITSNECQEVSRNRVSRNRPVNTDEWSDRRNQDVSEMESSPVAGRQWNASETTDAYQPPVRNQPFRTCRRLRVPSPEKPQPSICRNRLRRNRPEKPQPTNGRNRVEKRNQENDRNPFPSVYKVARIVEKPFTFENSKANTTIMAITKKTKRKAKGGGDAGQVEGESEVEGVGSGGEGGPIRELIKEVEIAESAGHKLGAGESISCPVSGCKSKRKYSRIGNLNVHCRRDHAGSFEYGDDGNLNFTVATEEQARMWKESDEKRRLQDRERKKAKYGATGVPTNTSRKGKGKGQSANRVDSVELESSDEEVAAVTTVCPTAKMLPRPFPTATSPVLVESAQPRMERAQPGLTATEQIASTEGTDLMSEAMNIAIAMQDDSQSNLSQMVEVAQPSTVENPQPLELQRSKFQILQDQSTAQPVPFHVPELDINDNEVLEVVQKLRRETSTDATEVVSDTDYSTVSGKIRTTNIDVESRRKAQLMVARPTSSMNKRHFQTSATNDIKRPKSVISRISPQPGTSKNTIVCMSRSEFHERLIEAGKWLSGLVPCWGREDRARELGHFLQIPARDARNIVIAFTEAFRTFAERARTVAGVDPVLQASVKTEEITIYLAIKHPIPPRVERDSRWGIQGISSSQLEHVATELAGLVPIFSATDATEAAIKVLPNVEPVIRMEVIQTVCAAFQSAARHIQAHSNGIGDMFVPGSYLVVNLEYIQRWNSQSAWFRGVLE